MTSEQWFAVADFFLAMSVASASVVVLVFVGAAVIDLIAAIRRRTNSSKAMDLAPARPNRRRVPLFVPKPARRQLDLAASSAAGGQNS